MSKITDYGIVLLTQFAREVDQVWTARDLSVKTKIPQPTVGKILKILSKGEILVSTRGAQGGYKLVTQPEKLTLAKIIEVLEGDLGITQCSTGSHSQCQILSSCTNKTNWQKINLAIVRALEGLTLADMSKPLYKNVEIARVTTSNPHTVVGAL